MVEESGIYNIKSYYSSRGYGIYKNYHLIRRIINDSHIEVINQEKPFRPHFLASSNRVQRFVFLNISKDYFSHWTIRDENFYPKIEGQVYFETLDLPRAYNCCGMSVLNLKDGEKLTFIFGENDKVVAHINNSNLHYGIQTRNERYVVTYENKVPLEAYCCLSPGQSQKINVTFRATDINLYKTFAICEL